MPAHRAAPAPVSRLRRLSRALLATAAAFASAVVIGIAAAGGTYAYLSSSTQLSAGTITAGTSHLVINGGATASVGALSGALLPGGTANSATPLLVANTGSSTVTVTQGAATVTSTGGLDATKLVVKVVRVAATATACPAATVTDLSAATATLAGGASMKVCVIVSIASGATGIVSGATASFAVPLDATQVAP